jgi:hypothetical protein
MPRVYLKLTAIERAALLVDRPTCEPHCQSRVYAAVRTKACELNPPLASVLDAPPELR